MDREQLGLVGGLAADRPVIVLLVIAFGLTALSAAGAADPNSGPETRAAILAFIAAGACIAGIPLLVASAAPVRLAGRLGLCVAVMILSVGLIVWGPIEPAALLTAPGAIAAAAAFAVLLVISAPSFGAAAQFAYVSAAAALLGAAGGAGLMGLQGAPQLIGPIASIALAVGAVAGFAAICDFAALFARGAERRQAAGAAAQFGAGPALYSAVAAAGAFGILYEAPIESRLAAAGFTCAAVIAAAFGAIFASAGALALRHSTEALAVKENRRREAFRQFWRPIRRLIPPSTANATVAIAAIAVIAAAFDMRTPFEMSLSGYVIAAAGAAGLIFFSLRAGIFVFFSLFVGAVIAKWIWFAFEAPPLGPAEDAAAVGLCAALLGQLAIAWRDARSPRLNARETAEATMADAARLYVLGALFGIVAYFAASASGLWPGGGLAAAEAGVMSVIGLLLAPALMTALSDAVRRELQ